MLEIPLLKVADVAWMLAYLSTVLGRGVSRRQEGERVPLVVEGNMHNEGVTSKLLVFD